MQALAEPIAPAVPVIQPISWMACGPWLRARRRALLEALGTEATHLGGDHCLHTARVDALLIFDKAIAELELRA